MYKILFFFRFFLLYFNLYKDVKRGVVPLVWQEIQCPCPGWPEKFYHIYPQQAIMDILQKKWFDV